MSIKLKALGAGLLAMVAMCALAVTNASALGGGTFDVGTAHTELLVEQDGNAPILHSLGDSIECAKQTYTGTATTSNFTALTVAPHYAECKLKNAGATIQVTMNGCDYTFTVHPTEPEVKHSTAHLKCPIGKQVELHWSLGIFGTCTSTIKEQTPKQGVVYTTKGTSGSGHHLTLDITASGIHTEHHETGIACGGIDPNTHTTESAEFTGNLTVKALTTVGQPAGVTVKPAP